MDLKEYFETHQGTGVLATANSEGIVDAAIYARPHILDDDKIAFIMRDRLSHANVSSNPHAAYLYMESGTKYHGRRFFLTLIREDQDPLKIAELKRRFKPEQEEETRFLCIFQIDQTLPLIGEGN